MDLSKGAKVDEDSQERMSINEEDEGSNDPSSNFLLRQNCQICGAPAANHLHYGAFCCYSCRAFFRRSGERVYKCLTGNNSCKIESNTRRACKKCRYRLCLEAGMKPNLVDRHVKKKKQVSSALLEGGTQLKQKLKTKLVNRIRRKSGSPVSDNSPVAVGPPDSSSDSIKVEEEEDVMSRSSCIIRSTSGEYSNPPTSIKQEDDKYFVDQSSPTSILSLSSSQESKSYYPWPSPYPWHQPLPSGSKSNPFPSRTSMQYASNHSESSTNLQLVRPTSLADRESLLHSNMNVLLTNRGDLPHTNKEDLIQNNRAKMLKTNRDELLQTSGNDMIKNNRLILPNVPKYNNSTSYPSWLSTLVASNNINYQHISPNISAMPGLERNNQNTEGSSYEKCPQELSYLNSFSSPSSPVMSKSSAPVNPKLLESSAGPWSSQSSIESWRRQSLATSEFLRQQSSSSDISSIPYELNRDVRCHNNKYQELLTASAEDRKHDLNSDLKHSRFKKISPTYIPDCPSDEKIGYFGESSASTNNSNSSIKERESSLAPVSEISTGESTLPDSTIGMKNITLKRKSDSDDVIMKMQQSRTISVICNYFQRESSRNIQKQASLSGQDSNSNLKIKEESSNATETPNNDGVIVYSKLAKERAEGKTERSQSDISEFVESFLKDIESGNLFEYLPYHERKKNSERSELQIPGYKIPDSPLMKFTIEEQENIQFLVWTWEAVFKGALATATASSTSTPALTAPNVGYSKMEESAAPALPQYTEPEYIQKETAVLIDSVNQYFEKEGNHDKNPLACQFNNIQQKGIELLSFRLRCNTLLAIAVRLYGGPNYAWFPDGKEIKEDFFKKYSYLLRSPWARSLEEEEEVIQTLKETGELVGSDRVLEVLETNCIMSGFTTGYEKQEVDLTSMGFDEPCFPRTQTLLLYRYLKHKEGEMMADQTFKKLKKLVPKLENAVRIFYENRLNI